MKKYLTYQDEGSNKFWSIDVSGSTFTVTFGKVGSSGQSSVKTFHDEQECLKEAEKLLREKLKKGYVEAEWPEQKTEAVLKFLSDSFHRFLKRKLRISRNLNTQKPSRKSIGKRKRIKYFNPFVLIGLSSQKKSRADRNLRYSMG